MSGWGKVVVSWDRAVQSTLHTLRVGQNSVFKYVYLRLFVSGSRISVALPLQVLYSMSFFSYIIF